MALKILMSSLSPRETHTLDMSGGRRSARQNDDPDTPAYNVGSLDAIRASAPECPQLAPYPL